MADTPLRTDVEYIAIHGERIAYRQAGSGDEVVVLVHGMAGSSNSWQGVIGVLAARYRVIAPDLLGHGRSDKPRSDYSLGAFAASLRDLLEELGVQRVTLVGHSLGGGIAMQFLYQHPEYCQRLVLVSSGGLGPDVGWMLRLLSAPGTEFVLPFLAPKAVLVIGNKIRSWLHRTGLGSPHAEQSWQAYSSLSDPPTRSAFLRTLRSVVDYRGQSISALSRLRLRAEIPTLVIWGDQDPIIPVAHGSAARAARPNSTLTVLPGLRHFPHVEAPAEVAAAIDHFITGNRRDEHAGLSMSAADCGKGPDGDLPEVDAEQRSILGGLVEDLKARQQIEVAVGLLMGLRGCSYIAAANEFRAAVDEAGIPADDLARLLVTQASTVDATAEHSHDAVAPARREQILHRWRPLLAARGLDDIHDTATIPAETQVRYGPENPTTIC